jgi:hypothetical protein
MKHSYYAVLPLSVCLGACAPSSGGSTSGGDASTGAKTGSDARAAAPAPRPPLELPAGSNLALIVETALSSKTSQPGDAVEARLASDLTAGGRVVAPAGTAVHGRVTAAVPSGRVKTRARLAFAFDSIRIGGSDRPISTGAVDITAGDTHKKDAITIGGAAGAGAVIGAIADGKKGAGIGALIGAGAGTGVVLVDKGKNVSIPAGANLTVELTQSLRIAG